MVCPRCKAALEKETKDGQVIDVCKSCGGLWLHKEQMSQLLAAHEVHEEVYPAIKCRECDNVTMKKINFLEYADIVMDYCPSCGAFWLDKGELYKMDEYIKRVELGDHTIKYASAYNLLAKLSEISYSIFH